MGIPAPAGSYSNGTPPAGDLANFVVAGSLTGVGASTPFAIYGAFNVIIGGLTPVTAFNATIQLQRSFDGGTTWFVCGIGGSGQGAIYVGSTLAGQNVSFVAAEPERGVYYRLACTAFTSGTINYRISGNGLAAMSWGVPVG